MSLFHDCFFDPDCPSFPLNQDELPFGEHLAKLFFSPREVDNIDFPIHGPNVVRLGGVILHEDATEPGYLSSVPGLLSGNEEEKAETERFLIENSENLLTLMEVGVGANSQKARELLQTCALYHDIGKVIRRANHPQIGANILRNYDTQEREKLVEALGLARDSSSGSRRNRFSLIASVIKHHDKFGVVSTGEAGLPIFSDILYFRSEEENMPGILKNITAVMLLNLADIAAVCKASDSAKSRAFEIVGLIAAGRQRAAVVDEPALFAELTGLIESADSCLGLSRATARDVLSDWNFLVGAVRHADVRGDRERLKVYLLESEKNPARAIKRILRLIKTSLMSAGATQLADLLTTISVETILVDSVGSFKVQDFCDQFATVVKLDYGLGFFRALAATCVKKYLHPQSALEAESFSPRLFDEDKVALSGLTEETKKRMVEEFCVITIRILISLVDRYSGVLGSLGGSDRRFGFEMKTITSDSMVLSAILKLLCVHQNKAHSGLAWIADEVTIWSMD